MMTNREGGPLVYALHHERDALYWEMDETGRQIAIIDAYQLGTLFDRLQEIGKLVIPTILKQGTA